jgi:CubicO group peptidase (beta-lactamase class C family)
MASGHTRDMLDEAIARDRAEPVRGFLIIAPDHPPGTVIAYSQPCTYTLASIIQRNAGMSLTQYLRPRLFDPLGIGHVGWHTWPSGHEQGFRGLHACTEDVAKLGQLYLQQGHWDGRQLIPADWVRQATSAQIATPSEPDPDWQQGYGYQFWMSRHGYRGDGAFGQFCVILPQHDTVIITTPARPACRRCSMPSGPTCCPAWAPQHQPRARPRTSSAPGCTALNCQPTSPVRPPRTGTAVRRTQAS